MRPFDQTKWREKLISVPANYQELLNLAGKRAAVETYADDKSLFKGEDTLTKALRQMILEGVANNLASAGPILSRQIVVLSVTYIEAMIRECFVAFFDAHPDRMHDYLRAGRGNEEKGVALLREITTAASKDELMARLSERAAAYASDGRIQSVLQRLEKVADVTMAASEKEAIVSLYERRHRLVHAVHEETMGAEDVSVAFQLGLNLSLTLVKACQAQGVPSIVPPPPRPRKRRRLRIRGTST